MLPDVDREDGLVRRTGGWTGSMLRSALDNMSPLSFVGATVDTSQR